MAEHPLLFFQVPELSLRERRGGGGGGHEIHFPDPGRQGTRLYPQFQRLAEALRNRNIELRKNAVGVLPDQVLVLETVGSIEDFVKAVGQIGGLQWLAEFELADLEPDEDFYVEGQAGGALPGRLFLVMTDAGALTTLKLRFDEFQKKPDIRFPDNLAPLKHVFRQLKTVRFWDAQDRMGEFGLLENWRFRLEHSQDIETLPFEAELWFKSTPRERRQTESRFVDVVRSLVGEVSGTSVVIPEISYHGILGTIPAGHASELIERGASHSDSRLILCDDIMFLRPVGQCSVPATDELAEADSVHQRAGDPLELGAPVLALLDGVPLVGHSLLSGRLYLDDPDGYGDYYQASQRLHGTGMASLICHGELDARESPITRLVYVRPILQPSVGFGGDQAREVVPDEELAVDLVHRAVRRLFENEEHGTAVAPQVKAINLSVCDVRRPFSREMSPMARLLDWLSVKYQVLFLVSAGNHDHDIKLAVPRQSLSELTDESREAAVFNALAADSRNRSLLSPAETLNALTIGAVHSDHSEIPNGFRLINPFTGGGFPNVVSAQGPGFRRSVKPDVLFPGGRQSLTEKMGTSDDSAVLQVSGFRVAPGQRVAWPGEQGDLQGTRYTRGTSNATALAGRAAIQIYDLLGDLRSRSDFSPGQEFDAVLIKALLVHGAHCEFPLNRYASVLEFNGKTSQKKDLATRLVGYGASDVHRVMFCTDHRVTVLGWGQIGAEEVNSFRLPTPPGLSGVPEQRRMIVTLAWLSPINCVHRNYRRALLQFSVDRQLASQPMGATNPRVRRGTVQHEVLEGTGAKVINDGDETQIRVECRADAGSLDEKVRFALAVTLEVPESVDVRIYQEIMERLSVRQQVPVSPRP